MNETIKRMAENSGLGIIFHLEEMGLDGKTELEKFAESIVRQCGFELVDESMQYNSPLIQEFTVKVANRIKTRFGLYDEQGGQSGWANEQNG